MQNDNQRAVKEMLKSFVFLLDESSKKTTKIYDGVIVSSANDSKWNIKYNGEIHAVKMYGTGLPKVNTVVKVLVPQGNQSLAWFFSPVPGGGGGSGDGATFIPSVSSDGVISWTNDKGLPNPPSVNIKGTPGKDGKTPNLAVGKVDTLEPGKKATVTITGTDTDPVLNFGIPKGDKGQGIYELPIATKTTLGGVKAEPKQDEDNLPVKVDENGFLWVNAQTVLENEVYIGSYGTTGKTTFNGFKQAYEAGKVLLLSIEVGKAGNDIKYAQLFYVDRIQSTPLEFIFAVFAKEGNKVTYYSINSDNEWKITDYNFNGGALPVATANALGGIKAELEPVETENNASVATIGSDAKIRYKPVFIAYFNGNKPTKYAEIKQALKEKKEIIGRSVNSEVYYQLVETGSSYIFTSAFIGKNTTNAVTFYSWVLTNDDVWTPKDPITLKAGGGTSVFMAKYGVTTYAEVTEALRAGKLVYAEKDSAYYSLTTSGTFPSTGETLYEFSASVFPFGDEKSPPGETVKYLRLKKDNTWSEPPRFTAVKDNGTALTDSEFYFPTSKLMKQLLAQKTETVLVDYNVTTFDEIFALYKAGKTIICRDTTANSKSPIYATLTDSFASTPGGEPIAFTFSMATTGDGTNVFVVKLSIHASSGWRRFQANIKEGGGTGGGLYVATYGETTFDELLAQYNAGKTIFCRDPVTLYDQWLYPAGFNYATPGGVKTPTNFIFSGVGAYSGSTPSKMETVVCSQKSGWKKTTLDVPDATIFWCDNTVTYEQVKEAFDSKRLPVMRKGRVYSPLYLIDNNRAQFRFPAIPRIKIIELKPSEPVKEYNMDVLTDLAQTLTPEQQKQMRENLGITSGGGITPSATDVTATVPVGLPTGTGANVQSILDALATKISSFENAREVAM